MIQSISPLLTGSNPRLILHNQLALTKFGTSLRYMENDVTITSVLPDGKPRSHGKRLRYGRALATPPPPLFIRLASNAFPDIGSVGHIEKKKTIKLNPKKSRNRRPWYPTLTLKVNIHIFVLTKCTKYCKNVPALVPAFLYAVTMLINFQIKRITSSEKWFNYVVTFF